MKIKRILLIFIIILYATQNLFSYEYYYQNLNKEEQETYKVILNAIKNKKNDISIDIFDFDEVSNIYYSVLNDNPELFYVTNKFNLSTNSINNNIVSAKIIVDYKESILNDLDNIDGKLNQIKYDLYFKTLGFSEFEIVKYCFEYLCNKSTYNINYDDQSLISVMLENRGVCASYAKSFKYLMDFFDIPCYIVEGFFISSNEKHAWNMVEIDENWYHIDVTQADSNDIFIDYSYLCILDEQIRKDHIISSQVNKTKSIDYFYLNNIGCYFNQFNENVIKQILLNKVINYKTPLIFTFKNNIDFNKCKSFLLDKENLFNILINEGYIVNNINYYINDLTDTVVFLLDEVEKEDDIIFINTVSKEVLSTLINQKYNKQINTFKLLFSNKGDFEKAKKILLEEQYIFEIIENNETIEVIYYDNIYRFDILI